MLLLAPLFESSAALALRQPCSDGMVLQQQAQAVIWGTASPRADITVIPSWDGVEYRVKADAKGDWSVKVQTPEASYEHRSISVSGDGSTIVLNDVLIGEVWFASGQSNMDIPMRGYYNCPIKDANRFIADPPGADKVRMYTEPVSGSYELVEAGSGRWRKAIPSQVPEMSATAFFFARQLNISLDVPVGIVCNAYGGSRVESWVPEEQLRRWGTEDLSREHIDSMTDYLRPFKAYNAMFNPLAGYTVKGFIWYQGCSNVGAHDTYIEHMSWMVQHWRERFGDSDASLPFYLVEIAPYTYSDDSGVSEGALLREAQHQLVKLVPNTGIVVTNDLVAEYEKDNIHPTRKLEIGERLAWQALHKQYGFTTLACESPEAVEAFIPEGKDGCIAVRLTNIPNGVDRMEMISALEVRGADGKWVPATSVSSEWPNDFIVVKCPSVKAPVEVRYGWGDFKPGNLHNSDGLPVSPFWVKLP